MGIGMQHSKLLVLLSILNGIQFGNAIGLFILKKIIAFSLERAEKSKMACCDCRVLQYTSIFIIVFVVAACIALLVVAFLEDPMRVLNAVSAV